MKQYPFIGRASFIPKADEMSARYQVTSSDAITRWIEQTKPEPEWDGSLPATFIVDLAGALWIAGSKVRA